MSLAGAGEAGHIHHLAVEEPTSLRSSPRFPTGPPAWPQVTGKPEAQCLRCSRLHTQDPGRSQSAGTTQRNCDVGEYACSFLCFSNSYLTSLVLHCLNRQTHPKGRVRMQWSQRKCTEAAVTEGALCVVSRVRAPPGHRHTGAWTQHPPRQAALTRPPGLELSPQQLSGGGLRPRGSHSPPGWCP